MGKEHSAPTSSASDVLVSAYMRQQSVQLTESVGEVRLRLNKQGDDSECRKSGRDDANGEMHDQRNMKNTRKDGASRTAEAEGEYDLDMEDKTIYTRLL